MTGCWLAAIVNEAGCMSDVACGGTSDDKVAS